MYVKINGKRVCINKDDSLFKIKEMLYKESDVIIVNSFPTKDDRFLNEDDEISFIKKGCLPSLDELEVLMVSRHTRGVFEKLKKSTVGIAGLGGLGSNIAISLARVGVGKLILVDFDLVEPSNLNRQQYYISHIGLKKVEAIKDVIKNINPYVDLELYDQYIDKYNALDIFKDCDVVVEAFDNPICKAELTNSILINTDKFIVAGSGMAGYHSSNSIKTRKINSRFYLCGDEVNEAKEGNGLMAPRVIIAAGHMSNMVLRILLNENDI